MTNEFCGTAGGRGKPAGYSSGAAGGSVQGPSSRPTVARSRYREIGGGIRTKATTIAPTRPPLREKAQRLGVPIYFRNTKNTASTRQAKAAMWFHWMGWPLKTNITMMVKTVSEITSWITLS